MWNEECGIRSGFLELAVFSSSKWGMKNVECGLALPFRNYAFKVKVISNIGEKSRFLWERVEPVLDLFR